jgi:hypothetical protein
MATLGMSHKWSLLVVDVACRLHDFDKGGSQIITLLGWLNRLKHAGCATTPIPLSQVAKCHIRRLSVNCNERYRSGANLRSVCALRLYGSANRHQVKLRIGYALSDRPAPLAIQPNSRNIINTRPS